ncbi:hypothetical protein ACFQNE_01985 [Gordonia phosphorivorans]|uniref:Uncharacterized protein n=1 Tax=Gordonia phosphorivorans TaxID=1056982 RepID=A0ABV6H8E5_9ACTN
MKGLSDKDNATNAWAIYRAFTAVGFSKAEAIELTKVMVSAALISAEVCCCCAESVAR